MLTAVPARRLLAAHVDPDGSPERRRLVEETWGGIERRSPAWTLSCLIAAGGPKYALAAGAECGLPLRGLPRRAFREGGFERPWRIRVFDGEPSLSFSPY